MAVVVEVALKDEGFFLKIVFCITQGISLLFLLGSINQKLIFKKTIRTCRTSLSRERIAVIRIKERSLFSFVI